MSLQEVLFLFLISCLFTSLLLALIVPFLKRNLLDTPNIRSSHLTPVPRGGGVAFVVVGSAFHLLSSSGHYRWIPLICIPLAITGFIDDKYDLPAIFRYLIQFLTASTLVLIGKPPVSPLEFILITLIMTAIINFTNFMDGIDGLVAGCGVVLMASSSAWALSGAIFGFLLWNWSPAKVFMGDVGSTFIGAVIGGLALQETSYAEVLSRILIGFPLFGDALFCLLRRCFAGENIFIPHRKHLFQRLHQGGWSHGKVSAMYILGVVLLLLSRVVGGINLMLIAILAQIALAYFLDKKVAKVFGTEN